LAQVTVEVPLVHGRVEPADRHLDLCGTQGRREIVNVDVAAWSQERSVGRAHAEHGYELLLRAALLRSLWCNAREISLREQDRRANGLVGRRRMESPEGDSHRRVSSLELAGTHPCEAMQDFERHFAL